MSFTPRRLKDWCGRIGTECRALMFSFLKLSLMFCSIIFMAPSARR